MSYELKLYRIGPDIKDLDLASDEFIPKTVVVEPSLIDVWLEKVKDQKYKSIAKPLDEYHLDYPGLVSLHAEITNIKIFETTVSIRLIDIELALEDLVEVYESRTMGPVRGMKLFHHTLLLKPETGFEIISKLQPHLEDGKNARDKFSETLKNIHHNLIIRNS